MDGSLDKLININASGLVLMACNSHEIWVPEEIEIHKKWVVDQIIDQMERDKIGVEGLSKIMGEKIALLNIRLEGNCDQPVQQEEIKEEQLPRPPKTDSGYKPHSTDMPTKLAEERKPVKKLIMEDCVQLGLIKRKRAKYVVTQMAGKQPADAEKEVVVELHKNLHEQVRKFIRKDKDGPWSSPKSQEELRLEIIQTPTVRSMLYLTREIFKEREDWKNRSHNSITGRIFGSRLTVDKK
jgi:hypothetical protein